MGMKIIFIFSTSQKITFYINWKCLLFQQLYPAFYTGFSCRIDPRITDSRLYSQEISLLIGIIFPRR